MEGHFSDPASLSDEHQLLATECMRWIRSLNGTVYPNDLDASAPNLAWSFGTSDEGEVSLRLGNQTHKVEIIKAVATARAVDGNTTRVTIEIGHSFITEGVAYEVERELNRLNGVDIDAIAAVTPSYPYLAYGALIDHLVDRSTSPAERIQVGTLALLSTSPGMGLIDVARRLSRCAPSHATQAIPSWASDFMVNGFRDVAPLAMRSSLAPELRSLGHGPLKMVAEDVETLFSAGFQRRMINPFLELDLCRSSLDPSQYRQVIAQLVDCCILQQKPDGGILQWIGPGQIALNDEGAQRLARLQAAMHFAQRHFGSSHLISTTSIRRPVECPFMGACPVQSDDNFPIDCETKPWMRFMGSKVGCWYSAGVKLLARRMAP